MTRSAALSRATIWWKGARPRTLGASVVPVVVGTAAAGSATARRTLGALVVGLGLQIGVNYLNDYEDGVRGVDTRKRAGPVRLVASGLASPRSVAIAGLVAIGLAAVAGLLLAWAAGWWLLGLGGACILGAVGYSGGPRPYGAVGLGELSVFAFFGLAATAGMAYVQAGRVSAEAWWSAVAVGLLAVGILVANNLRDIPTDVAAGKRTLAVKLGEERTRAVYRVVVVGALAVPVLGVLVGALPVAALLVLVAAPLAVQPLRVVGDARGPALVPVLLRTAAVHAAAGLGLAIGLWVS
jgi:1,4-dihydroxy-2-naphthoate octaprenyltransferase